MLWQLPNSFKNFASAQTAGGKAPSPPFMTHCHREFFHEQWKVLLDDDFIEAWKHGIVILCCDGIKRRFYPRIFTYSADYPEKYGLVSLTPQCFLTLSAKQDPHCQYPKSRHLSMPTLLDSTQPCPKPGYGQGHQPAKNSCSCG